MAELRYINAPIPRLAPIHPCLSLAQNRPKLSLGETCFLTKPPQELRHAAIDSFVLRLRPHVYRRIIAEKLLDSI